MYSQIEIHLNVAKIRLPVPSYLSCLVPPAARGVNADLRLECVNRQDTPIHERTLARRSKDTPFT